jgi:hypothetical protein
MPLSAANPAATAGFFMGKGRCDDSFPAPSKPRPPIIAARAGVEDGEIAMPAPQLTLQIGLCGQAGCGRSTSSPNGLFIGVNAKRRAEDELAFKAAEAPAPEPSPEPAAPAEAAVTGEASLPA